MYVGVWCNVRQSLQSRSRPRALIRVQFPVSPSTELTIHQIYQAQRLLDFSEVGKSIGTIPSVIIFLLKKLSRGGIPIFLDLSFSKK